MNRMYVNIVTAALALIAPCTGSAALEVVTTTEGLASLVREIAGDRANVTSLSRGTQDPHFIDATPTLAVKLRRADLLVDVGLELEIGWLPPLVNQSRNAKIQPGGPRRLTAASVITVLDAPTGPVDRSMGDLHPAGNPHFMSDPRRVGEVAKAISGRLSQLDPGGASAYGARLADFQKRLAQATARWQAQLQPVKGRSLIAHHNTLTYFLDWSGIRAAGYLEPKPGIAPPPSHLAALVELVKSQKVRAIVVESCYDVRSAKAVAAHGGAAVVTIPGDVGGFRDERGSMDPKDWTSYMDALVTLIVRAVQ